MNLDGTGSGYTGREHDRSRTALLEGCGPPFDICSALDFYDQLIGVAGLTGPLSMGAAEKEAGQACP